MLFLYFPLSFSPSRQLWKVHSHSSTVTQGPSPSWQTVSVFFQLSQAPVHYSFGETIILMAQQKTNGKSLRFLSFFFFPGKESERAGPGKCVCDGAAVDTITIGILWMREC